ncbi:MAG: TIGR03617 family F420-dependent LLM class oxidoreductase [Myxococcales bacterium]|nr:MAG: TIGR03617 family F420-dependent LLM class oxidoreductase [Myxococcales bacterium]
MPNVDTTLTGGSIERMAESARRAEELGFAGLVTAEASHEPYLPLMIAAEHTRELSLLTGIAVAFPRSPMITAHTAWDLQRYSRGRFLLGLGTQVKGHNERRFSGPWGRPGPRLRELIVAMRAIWDCWQNGTPLDHRGEFYRFDLMTPFFSPGPLTCPPPEVWIAGVNRYMCRLAGELCNGFHVHPMHTVRYVNEFVRPLIAEGAASAGRDPADVSLASACFVVTGSNDEEMARAAALVKQQISFYASTRSYRPILELHGWEEISPRLNELSRQGRWDAMGDLITDEMLAEFAVIGRREDIGALLHEKYDRVLDRIALYTAFTPGEDDDWWQDIVRTVSRR